ncbi:MAG TPA: M20/M25/M40 family metallo-hydrolase, partial [Sedimentibacter sp.]|nr:M20/M25/M40 family metallo-hydrolase [Sedimentibacter sp.]
MFEIESDQITNLIMDLVAIESPYYKEDKVMQFVYEWFKQNNIHAFLHEYHESKVTNFRGKNVVVNIEGKKGGPVICLNGHLDTVKPCIGWERDQNGEVIGNRLYGVGALDMKSGCASTMIALKAFVEKHKEFNGKIIATYVSVEEGPYGMGTNALIEEGYIKDVDISIITEPSAGISGNKFPDIIFGSVCRIN